MVDAVGGADGWLLLVAATSRWCLTEGVVGWAVAGSSALCALLFAPLACGAQVRGGSADGCGFGSSSDCRAS